ncbi:Sel1 repeat protein [Campylobacter concisus]|uniref:Sel1 repeat protein n=1 Tax=Campylobacter concisus TaxID=199 RepID=UPI0031FD44C2
MDCCFDLGAFYLKDKGTKQNYHIAKKYFYKACELGLQPGCDIYKKLNEKGL